LLQKLNKIHLTLCESSKRNIVAEFGKLSEKKIIDGIRLGKTGKLNGDNLDIRVVTNDIRMTNRNKDYHFFASNFVFDRVNFNQMSNTTSINPAISASDFLPTVAENGHYKETLKILLGRILAKTCSGFHWMKKVLPNHITHQYSNEMAAKSEIHMLPVSLHNETNYSDCIKILDEYVMQVNRWYSKAGKGNHYFLLESILNQYFELCSVAGYFFKNTVNSLYSPTLF
jgi:hypothetical protein